MAVTAIIAGGGKGTRMASAKAKQFLEIQQKPILYYTLKKFEQSSAIDDIVVVAPAESIALVEHEIVEKYHFKKIKSVVPGGKTRQESIWRGLQAVPPEASLVAIHDAVRPFVSEEQISRVIKEAEKSGAAILAVPVKDTVKIAEQGYIKTTPDRRNLWLAQTPQVFRKDLIIRAFQTAEKDNFIGTDDASLVERLGVNVRLVEGSYINIKITTPLDLEIAKLIIEKKLQKS